MLQLQVIRENPEQVIKALQNFKQGKKEEADALKEQTARHKDRNKELSGKVSDLEKEIQTLLYSIPNTPHESVPEGKDASENVIEKQVGEILGTGCQVRHHRFRAWQQDYRSRFSGL